MPKKRHKAMQLANATKVMRAHSTDIDPPGLVEFENAFQSRSDNSITLRSDWEAAFAGMQSFSEDIQGDDQEDYLNAAFHVSRAGYTIYFGRWAPFTWVAEVGDLFTIYDDGTIATDGIRTEVIGTDSLWLQQVWPGCLIRLKEGDGKLYTITHVTSDDRLLTNEPMDGSGEYEIFRVHPANRGEWPIKFESLGGYLVYGAVDLAQPIDDDYISGPFFSNIGRPNLGVWFGTDPLTEGVTIPTSAIYVGADQRDWRQSIYPQDKFYPVAIGGLNGALFARNWFGEVTQDSGIDFAEDAYSVNAGSINNISFLAAGGVNRMAILTLAGDVITIENGNVEVEEEAKQLIFNQDENTVVKWPGFPGVELYDWEDFIVGANGLLGEADGTIHSTPVSVALRGIASWYDLPTWYYVVVGDADVTDGVILYFSVPGSITRAITGTANSFTSVCYSRALDRFLAVGTNGECMTSDDKGATWASQSIGATVDLTAVTTDKEGRCFCAVGKADAGVGQVYLSVDGVTWALESGVGTEDFRDVAYNDTDGAFYAVTDSAKVFRIRRRLQLLSGPGVNLGSFGTASDLVCDVIWDGSTFIAVGTKIWTSPTGAAWTLRHTPTGTLTGVALNDTDGTTVVAVGIAGEVLRSTNNGVSWASVSSGTTVDLLGIIHDGKDGGAGFFYAIGKEGKVIRSANGSTWLNVGFPSDTDLLAISFSGNLSGGAVKNLYVTGQNGKIYVTYNNQGFSAADPWEEWEEQPTKAYVQDPWWGCIQEGRPPWFAKIGTPPYIAMGAMTWGMRMAAMPSTAQRGIMAFTNLSGTGTAAVNFWARHYRTDGSGNIWFFYPGMHSIAIAGWDTRTPIMVARWYGQIVTGPIAGSRGHFILCSTDGGRTWSTALGLSGGDVWCWSQQIEAYGSPLPNVSSYQFAPICSDGTDFLVIQSTTAAIAPQAVGLTTDLTLDVHVTEVE